MRVARFSIWVLVGGLLGFIGGFIDWQTTSLIYLVFMVLLLEIIIKFLIIRGLFPLRFSNAEPELWLSKSQDQLVQYTTQLSQLGFVPLTDYTIPSDQAQKPVARLFNHPQKLCFAEVGQVEGAPMFCSISGQLEKTWTLATTNMPASSSSSAISYAFLRSPYRLAKYIENASADVLLNAFEEWRSQASNDLGLGYAKSIQADDYFDREQKARTAQRKALLGRSITLSVIELFLFNFNPKTEWLGAYRKKSSGI